MADDDHSDTISNSDVSSEPVPKGKAPMKKTTKKAPAKKGEKATKNSMDSTSEASDALLKDFHHNPHNCTLPDLELWMIENLERDFMTCPTQDQIPTLREEMETLWEDAADMEKRRVIDRISATVLGQRKKMKNAPTVREMVLKLHQEAGIHWVLRFYTCAQMLRIREIEDRKEAIARVHEQLSPLAT